LSLAWPNKTQKPVSVDIRMPTRITRRAPPMSSTVSPPTDHAFG
jgi:hypothetical protein